jgi:hypothetical protein
MASPATAAANSGGSSADIPFELGSNFYSEKIFTDTFAITAAAGNENVHNITPGGFLRGVRLIFSSAGGVLGAGVVAADSPWSLFSSISLENIDGSPIDYPMNGYAYYTQNYFGQMWKGDPAKRASYSATVNPGGELFIPAEIRDTVGVLANTDARALYRIRYTPAASSALFSTAPTTLPTVTVLGYLETWSQPDLTDLHGRSIQQTPDGLSVAHILRHQVATLNAAGADNIIQLTNMGNEIRNITAIIRDSNNARQDYFTDPIRWRLDQRSLHVRAPQEQVETMSDFYDGLGNGTTARPTGVYVWPRYRRPGDMFGEFWLPTANATYLMLETSTLGTGVNLPGTVEIITDEVIPVGAMPAVYEGI